MEPDFVPEQPAEIHFQIGEKAADRLGRIVDGNGLKAEQVRLARHETLVHQIPGAIRVALKPEMVKSQLKGKRPHGQVMANEAAIVGLSAGIAAEFIASHDVQVEIMQHIATDPGRGWGMKHFKLPLAVTRKEYCVVDECTKCGGLAAFACATCSKTGAVPCGNCNSGGMAACPVCFGAGQAEMPDGNRGPCTRCNTTGKVVCPTCQGACQLRCNKCAGKGSVSCTECDASGFWTHIYDVTLHAHGSFEVDRQQMPQDVQQVMDKLGVRQLATEEHAEIFRLMQEPTTAYLLVPYFAFLPLASVEFSIEGKVFPAGVAGLTGRIMGVDPLLDNIIKPGINALFKLSKGPLAAEALVDQACKYRVIRYALSGLAKHSKRYVYGQIIKEYPLVLSDKYAKAVVKYADVALLALSKGPRTKGLIVGTVVAAAISAAYFMTAAHAMVDNIFKQNGKPQFSVAGDAAIWLLSYVVAWLAIKIVAAGALKRMLPESVLSNEEKGLPAAGQQGKLALLTTLVPWVALAFFAVQKPGWVEAALKLLPH
ncbi:MAG: hypothetical protein PW788_02905 [Micavibrio sp.]|nr:hypothetical protein [Micavibrio sp.]